MKTPLKALKRIGLVLVVCAALLSCLWYIGNIISGHRLAYHIYGTGFFTEVTACQESPSGRYRVGVISDGLQGVTRSVYVARWYWWQPVEVLRGGMEDFTGRGPEEAILAIAWSADERYIALILDGWIVDCFDFDTGRQESFGGLFPLTDMDALAKYHTRIEGYLGQNSIKQIVMPVMP